MSQAKVDAYKKEKANRKETMKKEKIAGRIRVILGTVVAVAIVGWAGYSAVSASQAKEKSEVVEINYDSINDYLGNVQ